MAASLGESRGAGLTSSFLLAWKGASTLGVVLPRGGSHTIDAIPCTPQRRPCDNAARRESSSASGRGLTCIATLSITSPRGETSFTVFRW